MAQAVVFVLTTNLACLAFADRIVLRNLTVIGDKTVASFDEDAVRFGDGTAITWDEIERATVAPEKQAAFDKMLAELGTHLYRIRQRLAVEDFEGLLPHAEAVYPRYQKRHSDTAYLVCQSLMWGRIAARRREEAIEPYLRCFGLLRQAPGNTIKLPGARRLEVNLETGISPELLPVWFDSAAAKKTLDEVFQTIAEFPKPVPDGVRVYYGTLAVEAGEPAKALAVLQNFSPADPAVQQFREIALAQAEISAGQSGGALTTVEANLESYSPLSKPVGLYWIGRAKAASAEERTRQDGMLQLLRIAAVFGDDYPDLAAAGLFYTMEGLAQGNAAAQSIAVRKELLERYGQTWHAARAKEPKGSPSLP